VSIATELGCQPHVRFTPASDRPADIAGGPFRANSGIMHRSEKQLFDHVVGAMSRRSHRHPISSMVTISATMLLSSRLRQHVGEASANTETGVVGDAAAYGRAVAD
jgi:hypothetical protein